MDKEKYLKLVDVAEDVSYKPCKACGGTAIASGGMDCTACGGTGAEGSSS